jgi:hypothetical protein
MQEKSGGVGCLGTYLTARVRVAHITRVGHGEIEIKLSEVGARARYGIRDGGKGNQRVSKSSVGGGCVEEEKKGKKER